MKLLHNRFCKACAALLVALLAHALAAPALRGQDAEDVTAAMVHRLCQFVTWPAAEAQTPFRIGLIGSDAIEPRLAEIVSEKSLGGRAIEVRYFRRLSDLEAVDVLFVSRKYRRWTERILNVYRDKPTLTIGDYEDFAERGGIVTLRFIDGRLVFDLNHGAATRAGLSLSPKLLAIANHVLGRT